MMTPEQRTERARNAAIAMHAKHDPKLTTAKARATNLANIDKAEGGRTAHFRKMAQQRWAKDDS